MVDVHEIMPNKTLQFSDTSNLVEDISSLYLNEKFSDVTLVVEGQKIPTHKMILAVRNSHFKSLFYDDAKDKAEITLPDVSLDGLKNLLKYVYTGSILFSDIDPVLQVLGVAYQFSFTVLKTKITKKLKILVNLKNVVPVLNKSNEYNLKELQDTCLDFIDVNATKLVTSDFFQELTQASMVKVLQRDTFYAPELEIFRSVVKWCKNNKDDDGKVMKCVRLSSLTISDIVTIVAPTKSFNCEELFQALSEILGSGTKHLTPRALRLKNENIATSEHKAQVVAGRNSNFLLMGNRDIAKHCSHPIDGNKSIIIELEDLSYFNHISMMLWDGDNRFYSYHIEVSVDQKEWSRIIDYSNFACRSVQTLYFNQQMAKYIKITGTYNSNDPTFHLVYFELYFKTGIPILINEIICPTSNVATPQRKAIVLEGKNPEFLLNGDFLHYDDKTNYTWHRIGSEYITVQLAQPFMISMIKLLLWDRDGRSYNYFIETSVNKKDWEILIDRKNIDCKSWQEFSFEKKTVVFVRITGTRNSNPGDTWFHVVHFECCYKNPNSTE